MWYYYRQERYTQGCGKEPRRKDTTSEDQGIDNIKMDLQEVGWGGMDCIDLGHMPGCCECGIEPSRSIKCEEFD
jgi:hypothetical protein